MHEEASSMTQTYEPEASDYAVPPGETLAEWLDEHDMSQGQLANRVGKSAKHVNQIVNGIAPITPRTALDLETVTGIPARFWLAREAQYQEDRVRLQRSNLLEENLAWLQEIPVAELRKRGFIAAKARDKAGCVIDALRFFGTATVDSWREVYLERQVAFRQSEAHEVSAGAVAAWLRMGELESEQLSLPVFKAEFLRQRLPRLRDLTRGGGEIGGEITRICGEAGVAVAFIPDVKGTRASGATHWVHGRPVVQLSLRGKTDDRFWFTVFHELAHVLLHGRGEVFIERRGGSLTPETRLKEEQADHFAADLLVPPAEAARLTSLKSLADVRAFAADIGVSPGVVVGRLHNDQIRPWSWGAGLKARVDFVPTDVSEG